MNHIRIDMCAKQLEVYKQRMKARTLSFLSTLFPRRSESFWQKLKLCVRELQIRKQINIDDESSKLKGSKDCSESAGAPPQEIKFRKL